MNLRRTGMIVLLLGLTASVVAAPPAGSASAEQWSTTTLPNEPGWTSSGLVGVSCVSATTCVAVGGYEIDQGGSQQVWPLVARLTNSIWSFTPQPEPPGFALESSSLDAVSCATASSCVAVGNLVSGTGFAEILSGDTWHPMTTFEAGLSSVSCTTATACVAVGWDPVSAQDVIATLAGTTWTTHEFSSPVPLVSVSCPTVSYCLAVGGQTAAGPGFLAEAYNGSTWSPITVPVPSGVTTGQSWLNAVSCWAVASCLVGGSYISASKLFVGFADVLNGAITTSTPVLGTEGFSGLSCTSANWCAGMTSGGVTPAVTFINGTWAAAQGDAGGLAISCTPPSCVAVGRSGDGRTSTYSRPDSPPFVGLAATADNQGYWLANQAGGVWNYGDAPFPGSLGNMTLNQPVVGIASTASGSGYWEDAADGGVFNFGDAPFYGSTGGLRLNQPMVGMAALPDGTGYWLVAADGGVFAFGGAKFYGSVPGVLPLGEVLNKPIVGMASTPDGKGYWLVASDGGVFSFGDAAFLGSMGGRALNKPVVGMAADPVTGGYWEVASDGGVFAFRAPFYGSTGNISLNQPVTAMQASPSGLGYRFVARDGGVFDYGDSSFFGSAA